LVFPARPLSFAPASKWDFFAFEQADPPAEEGDHVLGRREAEVEDVGAFEEEVALLRKEERESG
jgi:hypothetical protein